ncbi:DNA-directed RNA polymerases II 24 kDa polypeptide (RNA polymerase II subunit 5) [Varicellaria rhodocarpa]|nr:DNA-directed RNA polymerases II 24 kDa polypeptide (RNA polymerase II subunit 5) [Varicellaria rhodocarpa]
MADLEGGLRSAESDREVVKLWRAWRTVHEMCQDRGYELIDEEIRISLDDFKRQYTDQGGAVDRKKMTFSANPSLAMIQKYSTPPTPQNPNPKNDSVGAIWVEFSGDNSIGIKQMRVFIHHIDTNNFKTGILVTQNAVTPAAMKIAPVVFPRVIETFQESDLLVNITHHELVPKHVLLSVEEKNKLLERYRLKENQLPRIQTNDAVAKYLGLRRGQVVKIIRKSETAGRYASYRWTI